MSKGLGALKKLKRDLEEHFLSDTAKDIQYKSIEKGLKVLEIIISIFDIKIVDDYLIARRGETCIIYNLKLKQPQEIINLLREAL